MREEELVPSNILAILTTAEPGNDINRNIIVIIPYKLGLSCANLSTAYASYPLAWN